eukprot:TRINITY_DN17374_c0_g1_i3.p2 TRINITY_DN17374_c0_g1~~TRINITY_DN17374_c0_g1_i3.p2  ORF type:complete len:296 (-),score=62.00 TRINITY_DN17374_c0_g1_i3:48-935(-)
MRAEDFPKPRRGPTTGPGGGSDDALASGDSSVTSRGMKYWTTGAIPLIAPDVLGDIIATASDIAIVISDVGQVLSVLVNPAHPNADTLETWEGRDIRDLLTVESVPKLDAQLDRFNTGEDLGRSIELNHSDNANWEFPVRYSLHRIGPDGALLMLGRDLRPIAEMQQQLVDAQLALERDYEAHRQNDTRFRVLMETIREAVVFVSAVTGKVLMANQAAATLLGTKPGDLEDADFAGEFEGAKTAGLVEALVSAAVAETSETINLAARRSRQSVAVTARVFRAAGERTRKKELIIN